MDLIRLAWDLTDSLAIITIIFNALLFVKIQQVDSLQLITLTTLFIIIQIFFVLVVTHDTASANELCSRGYHGRVVGDVGDTGGVGEQPGRGLTPIFTHSRDAIGRPDYECIGLDLGEIQGKENREKEGDWNDKVHFDPFVYACPK